MSFFIIMYLREKSHTQLPVKFTYWRFYLPPKAKRNNYNFSSNKIDPIIVGQNLKDFRKRSGLKQKEIFEMLNITSSSYSVYETGKVLIQTSFIYEIAKKYNLSIDGILKSND